jgi:hypothetical protein
MIDRTCMHVMNREKLDRILEYFSTKDIWVNKLMA